MIYASGPLKNRTLSSRLIDANDKLCQCSVISNPSGLQLIDELQKLGRFLRSTAPSRGALAGV